MGTFTKGEIVLFPFPYTDLSSTKIRPCLVISSEMQDDLILCQITSKNVKWDDFCVEIKTKDTTNGSLLIDSFVRCNMIFTASKKQIIRSVCKVNSKKYAGVVNIIYDLIK